MPVPYADLSLTRSDCGGTFVFMAESRALFAVNRSTALPDGCPSCRHLNRVWPAETATARPHWRRRLPRHRPTSPTGRPAVAPSRCAEDVWPTGRRRGKRAVGAAQEEGTDASDRIHGG